MMNHSQTHAHNSIALQRARRGGWLLIVIPLAIIVALVLAWIFWPPLSEFVKGLITPENTTDQRAITHKVARERLVITVVEDGNLESAGNIDVKCEIPGGSTILSIIPDGTIVEAGREIVRLDSSLLDEQLQTQRGILDKAIAAKIKAEEDWKAAKIAVEEYRDGTFLVEVQTLDAAITVAEENLRSAQNILEHTERMALKGFATPLQVEADRFAVRRAELDRDAANTSKLVLEKYTQVRTLRQLEATRDAAEALMKAEISAVELEQGKLDRLTRDLSKCVINAPQSGMAVYYKERSRYGSSSSPIEEGAPVRERQVMVQIPDLNRMQAQVPIHESRVEQIRPGMRAHLKVLDRTFQGTVASIANQPESKSFFQAQVKEYPTVVRIEGDASGLRPGMTAEVEILIDDIPGVLTIPVVAAIKAGTSFYCWVKTDTGYEKRELVIGKTNDKMVEVLDGVAEGDLVVLNPRSVIKESLDDKKNGDEEVDTTARFGEARPGSADGSASGGPGSGGPGAGAAAGGPRGSGGPGGGARRSFEDMDADKDGKLSSSELPSERMLEAMDTDKDGSISKAEFNAARARMQQQGGGGAGGGPRPGGPGQVQ